MAQRFVRICPDCEEHNLEWARHCVGCQRDLNGVTRTPGSIGLKIPPAMALGLMLCVVAFALLWGIRQTFSAGGGALGGKSLNVLWHKFYGEYKKEWIVGDVKNQSNAPLDGLRIVGQFYDENGYELTSGVATLPAATLAPGQVSHFTVSVPYDGRIEQSKFFFTTKDGTAVSFQR